MSEETKRRKLGRGLSSLLGGEKEDFTELDRVRSTKTVPIEFLHPGKYQPRQQMDAEDLEDLARSIREKGVLMPLLVRRDPEAPEEYEIIAGERRWRAAQLAQLHEIPIIIKELSDQETLEVALIENLQRQDLSPLEEAAGYQRLMDEFSHTQEQLAESVGKSRPHIANTMRLLGLPEEVKALLAQGAISAGHARALLGADDPAGLAKNVVKSGLNVRQTERLVKSAASKDERTAPASGKGSKTHAKDSDTLALERDLANLLGLKVEIAFKGDAGALTIHYTSLEQLDDILARLSHGAHGHSAHGHGAHGHGAHDTGEDIDLDEGIDLLPEHSSEDARVDVPPEADVPPEDTLDDLDSLLENAAGVVDSENGDDSAPTDMDPLGDVGDIEEAPDDIGLDDIENEEDIVVAEDTADPGLGFQEDAPMPETQDDDGSQSWKNAVEEHVESKDSPENMDDNEDFEAFAQEEAQEPEDDLVESGASDEDKNEDEEDGADAIARAMAEDILNIIPSDTEIEADAENQADEAENDGGEESARKDT